MKDFWNTYENFPKINLKNFINFMKEKREKEYGFSKIILALTKMNTLFAINSKTGTILWKLL